MSDIRAKNIYESHKDLTSDKDNRLFVVEGGSGYIFTTTTAAALSYKTSVRSAFAGRAWKLLQLTVTFSTAPTTSESLTLTQNPGKKYANRPSTVLFSVNPSSTAATSVVQIWDGGGYRLQADDEVTLAFTNTDTRTIYAEIVIEVL